MEQNVAIFLGKTNFPNLSEGQFRDATECEEMGTIYSDSILYKGHYYIQNSKGNY